MRPVLAAAVSAVLMALAGTAGAAEPGCFDPAGGDSLADSRWTGTSEWQGLAANPMTLHLRPDCTVEYVSRGVTYANGTWLQRGALIEWQANDRFAVYVGQVGEGQIGGVMYNRRGQTGVWRFKRAD